MHMIRENNSTALNFKTDLYGVLRKHGMSIDEAIAALDDLFYDIYNTGSTT